MPIGYLVVRAFDADAATLNVARQMLKDNRIEAVPEADPNMLKLAGELPDFADAA